MLNFGVILINEFQCNNNNNNNNNNSNKHTIFISI